MKVSVDHLHSIDELQAQFVKYLGYALELGEPRSLYEPIEYILNLGGKRIRPICTLASCEMFGKPFNTAINQALAIEIFHNFSLVHDDIMDNAPLRRGKSTVHEKWNNNTAILSGDAMLILAYQFLQKGSEDFDKEIQQNFNKTAMQVCEGQQMDMEFEELQFVAMNDYVVMIRKKTAALLGESLRMGALAAGAGVEDSHLIYDFGTNFGIAFQLQDDLLDAFGDPNKFGKQIGGDIIESKKTILYLKAIEIADAKTRDSLIKLYSDEGLGKEDKVGQVLKIYDELNIKDLIKAEMNRYYVSASIALNTIDLPEGRKKILRELAERLMVREI